MNLKIGDLSRKSGCSVQTIRYYEKERLLPAPNRTVGNFRLYDEETLKQLLFIKRCRNIDLTIDEIRHLIELRNFPQSDCDEINQLIEKHLIQVNQRLTDLHELKSHLMSLKSKCSKDNKVENCGIMNTLVNE